MASQIQYTDCMKFSIGDRVSVNGVPAVVQALREVADEPVIVLVYDCGARVSYLLADFSGQKEMK